MEDIPDWWQPYAAAHPWWHVWIGVNGLHYARRPLTSPPWVTWGEDPQDLSDQITKFEACKAYPGLRLLEG